MISRKRSSPARRRRPGSDVHEGEKRLGRRQINNTTLSLSQAARRYMVSASVIIAWCQARFLPPPTWTPDGPVWSPHALDRHDLIVEMRRGRPSLGKCRLFEAEHGGRV